MTTKQTPTQVELIRKEVDTQNITFKYRLYRSNSKHGGRYIYSIEIIAYTSEDSDSVFIADVSRTRSRAQEIFELLHTNIVSPCTAVDILEDIL